MTLFPEPTKCEAIQGQDIMNIIVQPSTHVLSSCHFPWGSGSYAPPTPTELLSLECHLPFLRFAPENRLSTSCFSACVPCQPSPLPFPLGLGSATEEWSRRKSQFDLRMNYSTAIRPLSSCLLLSIKIKLLQRKQKKTHCSYVQNKLCYLGLIYIVGPTLIVWK